MKTTLRALIIIAAIWAILPPATYGLLFAAVTHWSALIDIALIISCSALVFSAFKNMTYPIWLAAFIIVTGFATSGFIHRFRDSGESGPLPFEWINSYYIHAFPLLLITILTRFSATNKQAEQAAPSNR